MKGKTAIVTAFVLMVCMMAVAVGWGAYKGWRAERDDILDISASLSEVLQAKAGIGHNILTVAGRHLPEDDPRIVMLKRDVALLSTDNKLEQLAAANDDFDVSARAVLSALTDLPSVQKDNRDMMYAAQMLPHALDTCAAWAEDETYNKAAAGFNRRLQGTFSGRVAVLLGIGQLDLFVTGDGV